MICREIHIGLKEYELAPGIPDTAGEADYKTVKRC